MFVFQTMASFKAQWLPFKLGPYWALVKHDHFPPHSTSPHSTHCPLPSQFPEAKGRGGSLKTTLPQSHDLTWRHEHSDSLHVLRRPSEFIPITLGRQSVHLTKTSVPYRPWVATKLSFQSWSRWLPCSYFCFRARGSNILNFSLLDSVVVEVFLKELNIVSTLPAAVIHKKGEGKELTAMAKAILHCYSDVNSSRK